MRNKEIFGIGICFLFTSHVIAQTKPIWRSEAFQVFPDSVVQGPYTSKAISREELISDYHSPANKFQSSKITFKFSLNGKDNEMKPGVDHQFNARSSKNFTPLINFGEQLKDTSGTSSYLGENTMISIRLDMRKILKQFETKGYFITYNGEKIFKEDYKGVFVAGATAPMSWDFDNLARHGDMQLQDPDGDGIYEITLILNAKDDHPQTGTNWKLKSNISKFPNYHSDYPITDAIYNLSLEEMINAVEPDSTFRTGKLWAGVWTRDISYSIILSMASLQPEVAKKSLLRKVDKNGRIIQDTGTGGAYPCSTDRMIWAVAAWEVYLATGDKDWLQRVYEVIRRSMDDDSHNIYDISTGLFHGESSFLDWREQTYPKWMQPTDIYESENLGTNAIHYKAKLVMASMALQLGKETAAREFLHQAAVIKTGINKYLWVDAQGYYAQYRYGRNNKIVSPRSEALGEALCVLFGIADSDRQRSIIKNTPVTPYGISCIYPQIPGIPPYHNNAVWPFVESFWALASAKAGNESSVMRAMAAIIRPAGLFLTNKENFVADNGDFAGTQINSSNMLWSLSGSISMIYKVIFGMVYEPSKLSFHPFVPETLSGKRSLTNFRYRNAILDISLEGYGNTIKQFMLDGKASNLHEFPADLVGHHSIVMTLGNEHSGGLVNSVANYTAPGMSKLIYDNKILRWEPVPNAEKYILLRNGKRIRETNGTSYHVTESRYSEYQVMVEDKNGRRSFASEPMMLAEKVEIYEAEDANATSDLLYKGFTGKGFVEVSTSKNMQLKIPVTIQKEGIYLIDLRYANGNGPTNTENKCGIRTLKEGSKFLGTVVLPQRGNDEWSNWGYSNQVKCHFLKGRHLLTLSLEPWNQNMNIEINQAMIDHLRITQIN